MVWGVCRRVLRNHHDAEDAFQATFLVLVRKAASIYPRAKVGNWFYGVAHQTALKARASRTKRSVRERKVADMPEPALTEPTLDNDLQPLLDQELSRLPEKYRTVIVLCDLEGKTKREAAWQLGLPEGTVASRVARARTMLAKRLAAKGVGLSSGALAMALSAEAVSAGVPPAVLSATIKAVTRVAAGQAALDLVSAQVVALSEGVVQAMFVTKLKIATAVLFLILVFGAGVVLQTRDRQSQAAEPAPRPKETVPLGNRAQSDHEAIQGRWKVVAWEVDGWKESTANLIGVKITGGRIFIKFKEDKGGVSEIPYRLDEAHRPKHIDWVEASGENKGKVVPAGIYHLEGDTLVLCFGAGNKVRQRPTKFETQPKDDSWLMVLQREDDIPIVSPDGGVLKRDGTVEPRDVSSRSTDLKVQVGAAKPNQSKDLETAVHELTAEIRALRQQLQQMEKRLSEIEKAKHN
jgi:RNA polymerase sigma factor (sigma-70 family)